MTDQPRLVPDTPVANAETHASVVDLSPEPASWDGFVVRSNPGSYLQTTAWADVKAANGWLALRFMGNALREAGGADTRAGERAGVEDDGKTAGELSSGGSTAIDASGAADMSPEGAAAIDVSAATNGKIPTTSGSTPVPTATFGAQLLVRRPRLFPWAFAYAPRGPICERWDAETVESFTDGLRRAVASAPMRVSHVRIEPEIELDGPNDPDGALRRALRRSEWRPGTPIQPARTRMLDLRADEQALWGDLRKKWRQYVNKAKRAGVTVVDADEDRLPEFYAIYQETAKRAGFIIRTFESYVGVWRAFAKLGMARLLFAQAPSGEGLATLFVLRVGDRVIEPYGGMTAAGAESRANYLLKWEAIRTSREQGAVSYDMWGLSHEGIEHFKTGFGGREIRYVGAWDLVLDPAGRLAFDSAQVMQDRVGRWRHGIKRPRRPGDAATDVDAGE